MITVVRHVNLAPILGLIALIILGFLWINSDAPRRGSLLLAAVLIGAAVFFFKLML